MENYIKIFFIVVAFVGCLIVQCPRVLSLPDLKFPDQLKYFWERNCSVVEVDNLPVISVHHGGQVHNGSFELDESTEISTEHTGFSFYITCVSSYPIEWVVNYFHNGYGNYKALGLHLQVSRKFMNFNDPSTYKFLISSKMKYKNNHGFKNFSFTCKSTHSPCLQRTLFTTTLLRDGGGSSDKSGIGINIETETPREVESIRDEADIEIPNTSPCSYHLYYRNLDSNRFGMRCQSSDGKPGVVKVIYECPNSISCMSFYHQSLRGHLSETCVKPLVAGIEIGNESYCTSCQERTFRLSQGFLACDFSEESPFPEKLLFFFTSIPQKDQHRQKTSSRMYFSMKQVDGKEMISLGRIPSEVFRGDQLTIVCNTSNFFFAGGTRIAVKYIGSDDLSFLKATLVSLEMSNNFPGSVYEANIPITTDNIERIYCLAPIWNSFDWVNKSMIITVQNDTPSHIVIAVSVTLLGTTLLCVMLFGICWVKVLKKKQSAFGKLLTPQDIEDFRKRPQNQSLSGGRNRGNDYEFIPNGIIACYNEAFEINRDQLQIDETAMLGKGHFGVVFKGNLKLDEKSGAKVEVAVKTLKTKSDVGALKALLSELKIMASVGKHLNVVNLIGAWTKRMEKGEIFVAVEYCVNGNMQNYLRDHRNKFKNQLQRDILVVETPYPYRMSTRDDVTTTLDLIKWAWEISKGMEFLSSKKVVHGDLATRNILLTVDLIAKISDFGLSRQLVDYYYVKEESVGPMPFKWMSIESLREMRFSVQSDIWSYGVTLWELFTLADVPYCGCSWSAEFVQTLVTGHRLGKPQYATSEMYDLMRECWKEDPLTRPSCFVIKSFFEDILTQCTYQIQISIPKTSEWTFTPMPLTIGTLKDLVGCVKGAISHKDYMQLDLTKKPSGLDDSSKAPLLLVVTPTLTVDGMDDEVEDDVFEQ